MPIPDPHKAPAGKDGPVLERMTVHDFLYGDRHQKLYGKIEVYLEGRRDLALPFIHLLVEGKSAIEIQKALGLDFRGDVLFAILLLYFYARDGFARHPDLTLEIPEELLP